MISFQPGDVVLVAFPFTSGGQTKERPALVLLDTGDDDLVAARVTTQLCQSPYDVLLTDWKRAGLLAPSVVRLHKLATLAKSRVSRRLGRLEANDRRNVVAVLPQLYAAW
jgi:mRNA interferase MazF